MRRVQLKDLRQGECFVLQGGRIVYVKQMYIRECGKYSVSKYDDYNYERLMKGTQWVFTDLDI